MAPDGSFAVVVRRIVERNGYVSHLWLVPLGGRAIATPRRLTTGRVRDSRPRISPDGRRVAFRRRLPGGPGIAQQPAGARPGRRSGPGGEPKAPRRRGGRLVAGRQPPRVHGGGGPAAVPRRAGAPGRDAARPGDPPPRLPLRRVGVPRPLGAPVRRGGGRVHGRAAADRRRLRRGRHHVAPRRADDRVRRRPQARRGPPAGDVDLGGRRGRGRWRGRRRAAGAAAAPRARRLGDPPGVLAGRPLAGGRRRRRPGRSRRPEPDGLRRPGRRRRPRPAAGAGPRPADRPLERHRPDRLDGREPDRAGLARSADGDRDRLGPRPGSAVGVPGRRAGECRRGRRRRHSPERTPTRR